MSSQDKTPIDRARRQTMKLLLGSAAVTAAGCCNLRGFPKAEIPSPESESGFLSERKAATFLAPSRVNTMNVPTPECIDTHAHFFNASDVTIQGYLEGPVAYSLDEPLRGLVKLLAPLADGLGEIAPTAKVEYDALKNINAKASSFSPSALLMERDKERGEVSRAFNRLTLSSDEGRAFRKEYERLLNQPSAPSALAAEKRPRVRQLDDGSLLNAMQAAEADVQDADLRAFSTTDQKPYAEGILAFVGYMLSSRRNNLITYKSAFTEKDGTIGVRRTLGALVNFDRWLKCAPRSAHEDQMRLHHALSLHSNQYMLPIISYNPWTDAAENGRSLELVEEAVRNYGFVGVKIYPPNGFHPWGNAPAKSAFNGISGRKVDEMLQRFWRTCQDLDVPVLAHAGPSMGSNEINNRKSAPAAWRQLMQAGFWPDARGPRVSLGHFGGEEDKHGENWTEQFATQVMSHPRGGRVYGDLAYWEKLQCDIVGQRECAPAKARLKAVLKTPIDGTETIADRVMYGSDWLMLSKEKNWPSYAQQLHMAIRDVAPSHVDKIFSANAKTCFGTRLQL